MQVAGWILFVDNPRTGWVSDIWRRFTHKDFRHVIIVQKIVYYGKAYYTFLDPAMGWLGMRPILDFTDKDIVEFGKVYGYDVKHIVKFVAEPKRDLTLRGLYSCVGVVKQLLGITDYSVITPRGLYRLMINKYNFKEIPYGS